MRASDNTHYNAAGYVVYGKFIAGLPAGTVPAAPAENCAGTQAPGAIDIDTGAPVALCPILSAQTNCQIVAELNAMIAAAAIDGTTLTIGNSYRNPQQQIDLRRQHCGPTHYDIYERPSGECHPPTARPGSSQHEKGLAIDFASCSTHSSACYVWLAANADRFGFYNLPSEAWHWSTTGS